MYFDEIITDGDKNRAINEFNLSKSILNNPNTDFSEDRAKLLIIHYKFDLGKIPKNEIIKLIEEEICRCQNNYNLGIYDNSDYIRTLCGYLFCIGDINDVKLIEKAKYEINFDIGCMIDSEWIDSLENGGVEGDFFGTRTELIETFIKYIKGYYSLENL